MARKCTPMQTAQQTNYTKRTPPCQTVVLWVFLLSIVESLGLCGLSHSFSAVTRRQRGRTQTLTHESMGGRGDWEIERTGFRSPIDHLPLTINHFPNTRAWGGDSELLQIDTVYYKLELAAETVGGMPTHNHSLQEYLEIFRYAR